MFVRPQSVPPFRSGAVPQWPLPVGFDVHAFQVSPGRIGGRAVGVGLDHGQPVQPGAVVVLAQPAQAAPFQQPVRVPRLQNQRPFDIGQRQFQLVEQPVRRGAKNEGVGRAVFLPDDPAQVIDGAGVVPGSGARPLPWRARRGLL